MERQFRLEYNGQQVQQQDLNLLGEESGLADDRVLAELLRIQPYDGSTVVKGVLPFAHQKSGPAGLVEPNDATGSVKVNPFRVFVGPRTPVGTDAKKNWRDIRSAIAIGQTTLEQVVQLAPLNVAIGYYRWDLIYAAVSVDTEGTSVARKRKDPNTKVVSEVSTATTLVTTVTLGVQTGMPRHFNLGPEWPPLPADAAGVYYVPLAYVRIPNGFNGTSTVSPREICLQAPILHLAPSTGVQAVRPATGQYVLSSEQQSAFGLGDNRPPHFLPPDMIGGASLLIALDLRDPDSANWSHQNGDVIDSGDWRNRVCRWMVTAANSSPDWANYAGISRLFPGPALVDGAGSTFGFGHTFGIFAGGVIISGPNNYAFYVDKNQLAEMANDTTVAIYADHDDGGKLKLLVAGAPQCFFFIWLDFSAPFTNR